MLNKPMSTSSFYAGKRYFDDYITCAMGSVSHSHPSWEAEKPYRFWGHWVKGQGHSDLCQNRF